MPKNASRYKSLDELLGRRAGIDRGAFAEQRANFAYASARLDGYSIARQSARLLGGETTATPTLLVGDELATKATKNAISQFELVTRWASSSESQNDFRRFVGEQALKELHRVGMEGIIAEAGEYRKEGIKIEGRDLGLPEADEVPALVNELTNYVVNNWTSSSVGHLTAYSLWRLLWIHPFLDGNGRVARALAYLILCLKAGGPLPGTPTMPELLASSREAYYGALAAADESFSRGKVDVSALRKLVERTVTLQLTNTPILTSYVEGRLDQTVRLRVLGAPSDLRRYLYAGEKVEWRIWQVGSYVLLYLAIGAEIDKAVRRQEETGNPFPGLWSSSREGADPVVAASIFQGATISRPIFLVPDTLAAISRTRLAQGSNAYEIPGTIYAIRLGISSSLKNVDTALDIMVSRHLSVVAEGRSGAASAS